MRRTVLVLASTLLVLFAASAASLLVGPFPVSLADAAGAFTHPRIAGSGADVVATIRAPRVAAAWVVGLALAVAGLCFQVLLKNSLASEYTLGVSSGAALGAVLGSLLHAASPLALPLFSFAGALGAIAVVLGLAHARLSFETDATILAGVTFTALANAALSLVLSLASPHELHTFFFWFLGSFANAEGTALAVAAVPVFVLGAGLLAASRTLDALAVGDDFAAQVGVPVAAAKGAIFLAASLLTALAVSVSGTIGFVGLVVPHLARRAVGVESRALLPAAALMGAALCVLADLLARTLAAPNELPVGVVTAFVGAPVFIALLARRRTGT